MGHINSPPTVLLLIAAFSRDVDLLQQGLQQAIDAFGPLYRASSLFRVDDFTDYYTQEMGTELQKQLWCFEKPIDPERLAAIKVTTNRWEEEFIPHKTGGTSGFSRSLNLDPGYIDLGKLVLASTKDHAHRIYLQQGIFAETTLFYTKKQWQSLPWSYPDYQSLGVQEFLTECRLYLYQLRRL